MIHASIYDEGSGGSYEITQSEADGALSFAVVRLRQHRRRSSGD